MNIKKYKKTILTMILGIIFAAIIGCADDASPGKFVALSGNNEVIYSEDGINWSAPIEIKIENVTYVNWGSVSYGNGMFVAMELNRGITAYSTNGNSWREGEKLNDASWRVCYGNGKFVAVGTSSTNSKSAYSPNGISWIQSEEDLQLDYSPGGNMITSVCYGNGKFVAVTANVPSANQVVYSPDGISWQLGERSSTSSLRSVCYGKGKFVAVGDTEATYSVNGKQWNTDVTGWSNNNWASVCYGNGKFVAIEELGKTIFSQNGKEWFQGSDLSPMADGIRWQSICYGDGKFVAVGYHNDGGSRILYSTDGIKWRGERSILEIKLQTVTYGLDSDIFGFL